MDPGGAHAGRSAELLHLPGEWRVRTGGGDRPSERGGARAQVRSRGQARLPRDEVVFAERWPGGLAFHACSKAANQSSRPVSQSGPQLELELVSSNARIGGSINLGAYSRLSDLLNFHDEILTVEAGSGDERPRGPIRRVGLPLDVRLAS